MYLPARVLEIVHTLYSRNVGLAEGADEQRRQLVMLIAQQVRFEFGPLYGTKRADPGRPLSKDAIARIDGPGGGTLLAWDLFDGTTRKPFPNPSSIDITGQVFVAVEPVDHLKATVVPPPNPIPSIRDLQAQINALSEDLSFLAGRVAALTDRLNRPITTSRTAYHSHQVTIL